MPFPITIEVTIDDVMNYREHLIMNPHKAHDPAECAVAAAIRRAVPGCDSATCTQEVARFRLGGVSYEARPCDRLAALMSQLDNWPTPNFWPFDSVSATLQFVPLDTDEPAETFSL